MWIPRWLGEIYARLFLTFETELFTVSQAREVLNLPVGRLNAAFSQLHSKRILTIFKAREVPLPRHEFEYVIGKGGITLFTPLSVSLLGSFRPNRLSTGIPELDEMLGGGLLENSTTLVSGPSGTGKTMIALSFAVEGAKKGENVLYISFEESVEQITNTLKLTGMAGRDSLGS